MLKFLLYFFLLLDIFVLGLPELIVKIKHQRARLNSAGLAEYAMMFGTVTPFEFHLHTEDLTTTIKKIYLFNIDTRQTTEFRMGAPMTGSNLSEGQDLHVIFDNELIMPQSQTRTLTVGKYRIGVLAVSGWEDDGPGRESLVSIDSRANVRFEHVLWDADKMFQLYPLGDHRVSELSFERFPPVLEPQRYLPSQYSRNESFWSFQNQGVVDELLDKWQLSFFDTGNQITLNGKRERLHHSFVSLKGEEFIDGEMIEAILKHWQRYQSDQVREQVEFLPSEFVYAPPYENNIELYRKIRDFYLPSIEFKRYYMMPFNVGNDHHWYLMVYNVPYRKFIVVDSNNHLKRMDYYVKDIAVFSYILTAFVGLRDVPQPEMYNVAVHADGWRHRLISIAKTNNRNGNSREDPLLKSISVWRSGYVQSDEDGYNCAIYTIMHALYLAENPRMLNYVTMKPDTNMNRSNVQDFGSVYRANMFAVLGAICELNLIQSDTPVSGVLDFPGCIGVHDSYTSFLH